MMSKSVDPIPRKRAGTRDAVETAIDLSKRDKASTWEDLALGQIRRWDTDIESAFPDLVNDSQPDLGDSMKGQWRKD